MTNEKKKGARFTFIDALLIVVILAIAVFICLYFINQNKGTPEIQGNVQYALEINCIDNELLDKFTVGDILYDKNGTVVLGKIKSVTSYPSVYSYIPEDKDDDEMATAYYPDKSDVVLFVEIYAEKNNMKYEAEDFEFYVGKEISFRTKKISLFGKCVAIFSTDDTSTTPSQNTTSSTQETTTTVSETEITSITETTTESTVETTSASLDSGTTTNGEV